MLRRRLAATVVVTAVIASCAVFDESMRLTEDAAGRDDAGRDSGRRDGASGQTPPGSADADAPISCETSVVQPAYTGAGAWSLQPSPEGCGTIPQIFAIDCTAESEPNNCAGPDGDPEPIALDTVHCGVVTAGDVDVYELEVVAGDCYRIDVDPEIEPENLLVTEISGPGIVPGTASDPRVKTTALANQDGVVRITVRADQPVSYKLMVRLAD